MNRRSTIALGGVAGASLLSGCLDSVVSPLVGRESSDISHLVRIGNGRSNPLTVTVESRLAGERAEVASQTLESGDVWTAAHYEKHGSLTVQVVVNDTKEWEDTHDIPESARGRQSYTVVNILEDEIEGDILVEV